MYTLSACKTQPTLLAVPQNPSHPSLQLVPSWVPSPSILVEILKAPNWYYFCGLSTPDYSVPLLDNAGRLIPLRADRKDVGHSSIPTLEGSEREVDSWVWTRNFPSRCPGSAAAMSATSVRKAVSGGKAMPDRKSIPRTFGPLKLLK